MVWAIIATLILNVRCDSPRAVVGWFKSWGCAIYLGCRHVAPHADYPWEYSGLYGLKFCLHYSDDVIDENGGLSWGRTGNYLCWSGLPCGRSYRDLYWDTLD